MPRERSSKRDPSRDAARLDEAVVAFTKGRTLREYKKDLLLRSAVERQIEIIGEAARHLTKARRDAHKRVNWKGIMGQRNVLAHEYGEISDERVWRVATVHVATLMSR